MTPGPQVNMDEIAFAYLIEHLKKKIEENLRKHDHLTPAILFVSARGLVSRTIPWAYRDSREKYSIINAVRLLVPVEKPAAVVMITEVWFASATPVGPIHHSVLVAGEMANRREYATIQIQTAEKFVWHSAALHRHGPPGDDNGPFDKLGPWKEDDGLLPHDVAVYPSLFRRSQEQDRKMDEILKKQPKM